jgi:hypothetical protein
MPFPGPAFVGRLRIDVNIFSPYTYLGLRIVYFRGTGGQAYECRKCKNGFSHCSHGFHLTVMVMGQLFILGMDVGRVIDQYEFVEFKSMLPHAELNGTDACKVRVAYKNGLCMFGAI